MVIDINPWLAAFIMLACVYIVHILTHKER